MRRYAEFEGKVGVLEYFCQVGTRNSGKDGVLEYFGQIDTRNLRERGCTREKRVR